MAKCLTVVTALRFALFALRETGKIEQIVCNKKVLLFGRNGSIRHKILPSVLSQLSALRLLVTHHFALVSALEDVFAKLVTFQSFAALRVIYDRRSTRSELVNNLLAFGTFAEMAIVIAFVAAV